MALTMHTFNEGIPMGKVILFYSYTHFQYPKRICKWQTKMCQELNLTGRIIIAHEGINATLGGSDADIEQYKILLKKHPQFADIDIKESPGGADCFPKLRVVVKNEIVNIGLPGTAHIQNTGVHLTPTQTHEMLSNKPEDLIILDTRNKFESDIGAFKDTIKSDVDHFRDFPAYIDNNLDLFKDKQVLMYCTGGVRCERATAYLKEKGIAKEVYQIEGGIHRYAEQYPNGFFRGKNYVFDARIALPINDDILGQCALCNVTCDEHNNCLNALCNKQYIACKACLDAYQYCCSTTCKELVLNNQVNKRPMRIKVEICR